MTRAHYIAPGRLDRQYKYPGCGSLIIRSFIYKLTLWLAIEQIINAITKSAPLGLNSKKISPGNGCMKVTTCWLPKETRIRR